MLLPQFNLVQLIQTYNQSKVKKISLQKDFGFAYFERTLFDVCQQTIAAINDPDVFVFSEEENQALRDRRSKLKSWRASAKTSTDSIGQIYRRFKQIYALPDDINEKKSLSEWRKDHYRLFEDTQNWLNFTKPSIPIAQFQQLKSYWSKHALFARYSHQAISKIAFDYLPNLIAHHKQALKDLKWRYFSIPKIIYTSYKQYLQDFLAKAEILQQQLAETMLARLQICNASGFKHADIMVHVADQLQVKHPPCSEHLTTQQFSMFHRYVLQHGNLETRKNLRELSWVKPSPLFPLKPVENKNVVLFVPQSIKKDVPESIRRPAWLYKGANLRYELCEQHSMYYVRLQQLPDISQLSIDISKPESLQRCAESITEKQQLAKRLLAETQQEKFTSLSFWHWRTKRFLKNYSTSLQDYQNKTIEAQLQLAEKITHMLIANKDVLGAGLQASSSVCGVLHQLMQSLHVQLQNYPQNNYRERFIQLEKQTEQMLAINRIKNGLDQLTDGKTLSEEALTQAKLVLNKLTPIQKVLLEHTLQPVIAKLVSQLSLELKRSPEVFGREQQYNEHFRSIEQLYSLLHILAPEQISKMLPKRISRYFLYYLNTMMRCGIDRDAFAKKQLALETFEQVLSIFDDKNNIQIGSTFLVEHLQNLKHLRSQLSATQLCDLQAEAQSMSILLGDDYLVQRVNKDCQTLDKQIIDWLKTHPQLRCSDETIKTAFQLRDTLTELSDEPSDAEVMQKLNFTTTEQVLIGLKVAPEESSARTVVPQLMKLSAHAQRLRHTMQIPDLMYEHKLELLHDFQRYIEQAFTLLSKTYQLPNNIGQNKQHSPLFFKTYTPDPDSLRNEATPNQSQDLPSAARNTL